MPRFASLLLALALAGTAAAQAPPQEVLFPGQTGAELRASIRAEYRPAATTGDNDDLYSIIDRTTVGGQDGVVGVYTGYFVPFDCVPSCDPSQDVFNNEAGINQEHTWPISLLSGIAEDDLHNIFPTQVRVNADRGSLRFAEIADEQANRWYEGAPPYLQTTPPPLAERDAYSELRSNTSFEPREVHEGNVARALFYMNTVYDTQTSGSFPFDTAQQQVLLDWHYLDPADQAEYDRTFRIAPFQTDRPNPFVLDSTLIRRAYPDLVPTAAEDVQPAAAALTVGPNPFHDAATVRLTLAAPAAAEVAVFDALGRRVALLHQGPLRSGETAFRLSGASLPPGLYLVRAVTAERRLTQHLVRAR